MELAVEVMRRSIDEQRADGKACPKVGAVLLKADGTIETAFRGELRDGDHAEFALLERKNRNTSLDGSILFATLEPCAPGARKQPKLGCAERIALARIREVWVGIEDPDPTVDRKGIKYLQAAGVTVRMFDRDLQEIIQQENQPFIAQALQRAEEAQAERPGDIPLSPLEAALPAASLQEFSVDAMMRYRTIAGIPDRVQDAQFLQRLLRLGLLGDRGGVATPTGFGLLLFGREPRLTLPQAGLLATIRYADGTEEFRNFEGPMVLIPEELEEWLTAKLPQVADRSAMRRTIQPALPFELVREAVVNALVHRDYDIGEAKVHFILTPDTIVVKSPGRPIAPITVEQLQTFSAPMLSRNPALHFVFAQMDLAEERGLGLRSLREMAGALGLPLPTFAWEEPYLVLTLYRHPSAAAVPSLPGRGRLSPDEQQVWEFATTQELFSSRELGARFGFDERKAQRLLGKLTRSGVLQRVGKGPATRYRVKPLSRS